MRAGQVKHRREAVEEEVGAKPTRFMIVSRPPTEAQLAHRDALEAEGFSGTFVLAPFGTPQEPSP